MMVKRGEGPRGSRPALPGPGIPGPHSIYGSLERPAAVYSVNGGS